MGLNISILVEHSLDWFLAEQTYQTDLNFVQLNMEGHTLQLKGHEIHST